MINRHFFDKQINTFFPFAKKNSLINFENLGNEEEIE